MWIQSYRIRVVLLVVVERKRGGEKFCEAQIESHDSVVRLNQARADLPLKGNGDKHTQTKDVGERSNFRALSKPRIHKYSPGKRRVIGPSGFAWSGGRI